MFSWKNESITCVVRVIRVIRVIKRRFARSYTKSSLKIARGKETECRFPSNFAVVSDRMTSASSIRNDWTERSGISPQFPVLLEFPRIPLLQE
jgi:hypothetical protein